MKKTAKALFLFFVIQNMNAQELNLPTFTQYLADSPFLISPSFAGIGDYVKVRANGFSQWVGIKDAPENQSLAVDLRIKDRSGMGLYLYNDKNGNTKQSGFKLSYAHHLVIDKYEDQFLSLGLSYNLNQFKIDIANFTNNLDPGVTNNRNLINHNFDVGILYRINYFYTSFTAANLLNKEIDLFTGVEPLELRNYQVFAGYNWKRNVNSDFEIEPSIFYQYFESDKRSSTDVNVKFRHKAFEDYYWIGVSYRFLNDQLFEPLNISPMAGMLYKNFYFAYSYQVTLNELINYNSGTHMVTVGVDLFQGVSNCPCTN